MNILRDGLVRGASLSFLLRIGGMGLAWLAAVALARLLGAEGYGVYSFVLSVVTMLRLPATFGTPMLLVREVSAARATEDWPRMKGAAQWALRFSMVTSLPIVTVAGLTLLFAPGLIPESLRASIPWAMALVALTPLEAIRSGVLRGLRKIVLGQVPEQLIRPAALLTVLLVPMLWGWKVDSPPEAIAAYVTAVAASWIAGTVMLIGVWPKAASEATALKNGKAWAASLLPLGLGNAMYLIDGEVAVLALGLVGSDTETGAFKAATQFAQFAAVGYVVINTNVTPRLASAWARGDLERVQDVITRGSRLSVAYCLPAVVSLALLGKWGIPFLMGPGFEAAWAPLVILCAGHLVNSAFGSAPAALNMSHNERCNTVGFAVGLATNVALTLALTPLYGAVGAASAVFVSVTLRNLIVWRYARSRVGVETGFWGRRAA